MKKTLNIKRTDGTPAIFLSKDLLKIEGRSVHTNKKFFENILTHINNLDNNLDFTIIISLDYINTLSIYYLRKILKEFEKFKNPIVKWYYEEDDDYIKQDGIDLEKMINIQFEFIEI